MDVELLVLRHEVAVLRRIRPRRGWTGSIAVLAALVRTPVRLVTTPPAGDAGHRLAVAPVTGRKKWTLCLPRTASMQVEDV